LIFRELGHREAFVRSGRGSVKHDGRVSVVRVKRLLLACALLGCGAPVTATDAAVVDAASRDAPMADAAPSYDPSAFDCRAVSTPARRSPLALTCPMDPTCTGMRIASSHRGAGAPGGLTPENTLSGIRAAIALGADMVEMDVRPTSDEVLVLMHDGDVDRTTTSTGPVSAMTLAEVQALTLRTEDFRGDYSCDHVPTFAEALALAEGHLDIIVDASKTDRVDLIVGTIQAAGAVDRVVFDTADTDRIRMALALEPALRFLIRATTEAELNERLAAVAPATPIYIHLDTADPAVMSPIVHAAGYRAFALGFVQDVLAGLHGTSAYESLFTDGVDMVQSNRIDLLGEFLGR
jgi:glycerophosphoryl diester phosphodiesterase